MDNSEQAQAALRQHMSAFISGESVLTADLRRAINELLDGAECAAKVLDNYADMERDGRDGMVPNSAAVMSKELPRLIEWVESLMPKDQANA